MHARLKSLPLGCGLLAIAGYAALTSPHPDPGSSAEWIVQHGGLSRQVPLLHPCWGLLVRATVTLSSQPALWLNLFSAAAGALGIALFALFAQRLRFAPPDAEIPAPVQRASVLAATVALALMLPIAQAATRAHPGSFELVLLLAWLLCAQTFARTGRLAWALGTAALAGPAALEIEAVPVAAAAVAALMLVGDWRCHPRRWRPLAAALPLAAASIVAALLLAAWRYQVDPANGWREDLTTGTVIRSIAAIQWQLTRALIGGFGWLYLLLITATPFLLARWLARHPSERAPGPGHLLLALALALPPVLLALNMPLAPWRLVGTTSTFMLAALLSALTIQAVTAYVCCSMRPLRCHPERWPAILAGLTRVLTLALALAGGAHLAHLAATRPAQPFYTWARLTIDALGPRNRLVTDGSLDNLLHLAARAAGRRITCLDFSRSHDTDDQRWLTAQFPTAPLRALAHASPAVALREWIRTQPAATDQLAILPNPDPWLAGGVAFIPDRTLYLGTRTPANCTPDTLLAHENATVLALADDLSRLQQSQGPTARLAALLLDALSRHANDLGLALENLGTPTHAREAYALALRVRPDNLCALLNREQLDGPPTDSATDPLAAALDRDQHVPLPLLTARYGHLRNPQALARLSPPQPMRSPDTPTRQPAHLTARHVDALETALRMQLDDPEAIPDGVLLGRLLTLDPGNATANFALGVLLYRHGHSDLAQAAFRRSLNRRSTPAALNNLAWIFQERGDFATALPLAQEALRLAPDSATTRHTLDTILAALGLDTAHTNSASHN
jgi:tetratricopeptide (TPR) repeat protein